MSREAFFLYWKRQAFRMAVVFGDTSWRSELHYCCGGLRPPAVHFAKEFGGHRPPLQCKSKLKVV
jgi:hypothetical protein